MLNKPFSPVFALLFVAILLFSNGCRTTTPNGDSSLVQFVIKARYNGDPLVMNQRYIFDGREVSFSKLQFFIADLAITDGNIETEIEDIGMVDITSTHTTIADAEVGFHLNPKSVPVGTYDGIRFGLGVPSDLNKDQPADYASNHPLGQPGEYWDAWGSYIFSKIEGKFDMDNEPTQLEGVLNYHVGTDALFRSGEISNQNIEIVEGATRQIVLQVDMLDLLRNDAGQALDIANNNISHSNPDDPADFDLSVLMANNWAAAIRIVE